MSSVTPARPQHPLPESETGLLGLRRDVGLSRLSIHQVRGTHAVTDSAELLEGLAGSTVRTAALLRGHSGRIVRRIQDELARGCEPYRSGAQFDIPVAAIILAGQRCQ
jgi:histidine ammonia-lyase